MKTLSLIQMKKKKKKNRYQNERVSRDGHSMVLIMICGGQAQVHRKHCMPPTPPLPSSFSASKKFQTQLRAQLLQLDPEDQCDGSYLVVLTFRVITRHSSQLLQLENYIEEACLAMMLYAC